MEWDQFSIKTPLAGRTFAASCLLPHKSNKLQFLLFGGQKNDKQLFDDLLLVQKRKKYYSCRVLPIHGKERPPARTEGTLVFVKPKHLKKALAVEKNSSDTNLYSADADTLTMQAILFGGKQGRTYLNDVWILNMVWDETAKERRFSWTKVQFKNKEAIPAPRASHTAICVRHHSKHHMFVFGGTDGKESNNELWCFRVQVFLLLFILQF